MRRIATAVAAVVCVLVTIVSCAKAASTDQDVVWEGQTPVGLTNHELDGSRDLSLEET